MRNVRLVPILLAALAAPAAIGCSGGTAEAPPATAESAMTRAPVAQSSHGMVRFMGEAFADVPLQGDQRKQIEQLAQDAETRHAPVAAAWKAACDELADQVEKGAIDHDVLAAKIDAAAASVESVRRADRAAFEKLHGILDSNQRVALVDAIEKRMHDKMEEHKPREHMMDLAGALKLTDAQRDQVKDAVKAEMEKNKGAGMREFRARHEKGKKTLEAFKEDNFSMDRVAPPEDVRAHAREGSERILGFVSAVLPILTPEQRVLAAQKIREHADRPLLGD